MGVRGGPESRFLGGVWDPLKNAKKCENYAAVTLLTLFPPNYIVFKMPFALSASVEQKIRHPHASLKFLIFYEKF